ncbi:MAG: prepilin-type N-terminal cleavage/methylation domain-containing protein [Capsulimonadales bacterium]|nr:prepilin-type N-terminal cleavage/methylation domain-containing protein [Capsulimonadales bacterium]
MKRHSAFTLIELLIVIGIIVVLIAILLPVLFQTRAKSRQNVCLSNSRQVWLSIRAYIDDNDGGWPTTRAWLSWQALPACPDVTGYVSFPIRGVPGYGYNTGFAERFTAETTGPPGIYATTDSMIPFPTTTVCFCDSELREPYQSGFYPKEDRREGAWIRHQGGANYTFADGHTKWYIPEAVIPGNAGLPPVNGYLVGNDGVHPTFNVDPPFRIPEP